MGFTTVAEFDQAYQSVHKAFATGTTRNKEWRRHQLKRTWWMVEENKERIADALYADLHRHRQESYISDCSVVQNDILNTLKKLDEWTKDEKPSRWDPVNFLGGTVVRMEPKGVVLIIGAWNFPITLSLQPLVAAIAAGCALILKPSDLVPAVQDLLIELIPQYLDHDAIRCVSAGGQEMPYILEQRYDHIFYTGSARIGKVVHAAAAKHLTPTTLELGGLAPAIVTPAANIDLSAKRIASVKFTNAGQICVSINHILVDPIVKEALISNLIRYFDIFTEGKKQPEYSTHIVNERSFDRLDNLLRQTSGQILYGGHRDRSTRFFGPTIVSVKPDDILLSEELFGPILPIVEADLTTAIALINGSDRPLAIYPFTDLEAEKQRVLNETRSGGLTFNDGILQTLAMDSPFGGTGSSGHGAYHGPYGVREFSHLRTFCNGFPTWMELIMNARYPPYTLKKARMLAPQIKPPFDRDGKDVGMSSWTKVALGTGALALSIAVLRDGEQVSALSSRVLKQVGL
ncbi:hypothetical protein N7492_003230 [Penicillium capsulatum]|uniref:Aldehyde dehydrogenase n=1 Tax=Penicillium capsulatum TaxID=69766 RepID=A0A9W9IK73_9EURO|nr:hypothetical protein N7492_003230 [Penicillium capsulatum]KAJ6122183.1 hypothetical protein N7512_004648 [Penicillium capsulatum]